MTGTNVDRTLKGTQLRSRLHFWRRPLLLSGFYVFIAQLTMLMHLTGRCGVHLPASKSYTLIQFRTFSFLFLVDLLAILLLSSVSFTIRLVPFSRVSFSHLALSCRTLWCLLKNSVNPATRRAYRAPYRYKPLQRRSCVIMSQEHAPVDMGGCGGSAGNPPGIRNERCAWTDREAPWTATVSEAPPCGDPLL